MTADRYQRRGQETSSERAYWQKLVWTVPVGRVPVNGVEVDADSRPRQQLGEAQAWCPFSAPAKSRQTQLGTGA